jgi:hypothetical protein
MFYNDHEPAHFHALYAEYQATTDIENLSVLEGRLPRRALELVLDWAELINRPRALAAWRRVNV